MRLISVGLLLLLVFPARPVSACEIPPELLANRTFTENQKILEGEVLFVADARLHDFECRTAAVSGLVMARGLQDAVGCVAIDARGLETGIALRNKFMWEDHLEVTKFPEIRFVLTGLADVQTEAENIGLTLEGELFLHGVARDVRIPAKLTPGDGRTKVEGRTKLRMSDYGIARPAFLFITVKDEVEVRFRVLMGEAE